MKNRNWFWGFFFLLAAIFVIASQIGSFGQIGVLSIAATVLLAALCIHSAIERNFFGIFIPLALLYMIYQQPLHLIQISIWLLLLASILASIGFSIIFLSHTHHSHSHIDTFLSDDWHGSHDGTECFNQTPENINDNNPCIKVSFGSSSKYLHADCLKSGQFSVSFGELAVFFDRTLLNPDGAEIFLDCSFGDIKLFVPRNWLVIDHIRTGLGSVENDGRMSHPDENAPRLTLTGHVQLGDISIHYI